MKRGIIYAVLCVILMIACAKQAEIVVLDKTHPAYELGKALSDSLAYLDPDSNQVLASSKYFNISAGEVLQTIHTAMGNQAERLKTLRTTQLARYANQITTKLAEEKLLTRAANKAGVKVSSAQVDSILDMQYQRVGGEEKYAELLQKYGLSLDFVKKDIERSELLGKYIEKYIDEEATVSEEAVKQAYDEAADDTLVSVRHILFLTQDKSNSEKKKIKKEAEKVLAKARQGEDFAELAATYTEDPGSKENGGLYENFKRGDMVKPFEEASFTLPIGGISGLVETRYGYHIIKVIDRKANDKTFEEAKPEIEKELKRADRSGIISKHIEELKEKANFEMGEMFQS